MTPMSDPHSLSMMRWGRHGLLGDPPPMGWLWRSASGFGALHYLAWGESDHAAEILGEDSLASIAFWRERAREALSQGSDPSLGEHEMLNTPLHWCCWHLTSLGVAQALLSHGAPTRALNRAEETPERLLRRLLSTLSLSEPAARRAHDLLGLLRSSDEARELLSLSAPSGAFSRGHPSWL